MNNLIERLRSLANDGRCRGEFGMPMMEAADEIERLTKAIDQLRRVNLGNSDLIEQLEAEVDKLQAVVDAAEDGDD